MKTTQNKHTLKLALVVSLATLAAGCSNGNDKELDSYFADIKSRPVKKIPPIPEIKAYVKFVYPEHRVDPFDVTILAPTLPNADPKKPEKQVVKGVKLDSTREPEFLEKFPLEAIKMVGTMNRNGQLWALVRVPESGIKRVRKGQYMGLNHGKIQSISEDSIGLQEYIANGLGGFIARDNTLELSSN